MLTGYDWDVIEEGDVAGATADDDVELTEFSDERRLGYWRICKIGLYRKSILNKTLMI
jgi:hypothetical protein